VLRSCAAQPARARVRRAPCPAPTNKSAPCARTLRHCRARSAASPYHARGPIHAYVTLSARAARAVSRLESTAVTAPRAPRALRPHVRTSSISKIQDVVLASSCASTERCTPARCQQRLCARSQQAACRCSPFLAGMCCHLGRVKDGPQGPAQVGISGQARQRDVDVKARVLRV